MYSNCLKLIELVDIYLGNEISPPDFEKKYIELWRKYRDLDDKSLIRDETQKYLDSIFCALDIYCSDPSLRDENAFDEEQLLCEVRDLNQAWNNAVNIEGGRLSSCNTVTFGANHAAMPDYKI